MSVPRYRPILMAHKANLLGIVSKCMLHGPCGVRNPYAPCIREDGSCKNDFPKNFSSDTVLPAELYPRYRRRDNGIVVRKGDDVVPYSPLLLKKYAAHINVEVVANILLVKYTFQGHDRAHVELGHPHDELQAHIDARYLGAAEAAWRLFEFPIHGCSHAVERLAVHLPGQIFVAGEEVAAAEAPKAKRTTLTAWFALNAATAEGGCDNAGILQSKYQNIPSLCTWTNPKKNGNYALRSGSSMSLWLAACPLWLQPRGRGIFFICCCYIGPGQNVGGTFAPSTVSFMIPFKLLQLQLGFVAPTNITMQLCRMQSQSQLPPGLASSLQLFQLPATSLTPHSFGFYSLLTLDFPNTWLLMLLSSMCNSIWRGMANCAPLLDCLCHDTLITKTFACIQHEQMYLILTQYHVKILSHVPGIFPLPLTNSMNLLEYFAFHLIVHSF